MADTTRDIVLGLAGDMKEMRAEMRSMTSKMSDVLECYSDLHEVVNGNGKPGLKDEVKDLKTAVGIIKQRHASEDVKTETIATRKWEMGKLVIGLAVGEFVSLIGLAVAIWLGLKA